MSTQYKIPEEICNKTLEELNMAKGEKVIEYMHKKGIYTVRDYIRKRDKIPEKWAKYIKSIIILQCDLTPYDFKD